SRQTVGLLTFPGISTFRDVEGGPRPFSRGPSLKACPATSGRAASQIEPTGLIRPRRGPASRAEARTTMKTYLEGHKFNGRVGRTWKESEPSFPVHAKAPPGAPNIVYVVLDDVGYGWSDTFGG